MPVAGMNPVRIGNRVLVAALCCRPLVRQAGEHRQAERKRRFVTRFRLISQGLRLALRNVFVTQRTFRSPAELRPDGDFTLRHGRLAPAASRHGAALKQPSDVLQRAASPRWPAQCALPLKDIVSIYLLKEDVARVLKDRAAKFAEAAKVAPPSYRQVFGARTPAGLHVRHYREGSQSSLLQKWSVSSSEGWTASFAL